VLYRLTLQNVELIYMAFNPLNTKLNPICHLLALLGSHYILHVGRIRVKIQSLFYRKHSKLYGLIIMLREVIAFDCEDYRKSKYSVCEEKAELL
jgi:hypothetical protein